MSPKAPNPAEGIRHYQFLSGLALAILALLQVQRDLGAPDGALAPLLLTACMAITGGIGIFTRRSLSPLLVLLTLGINQLLHQVNLNRLLRPELQGVGPLRPYDLALCMAALAYVAGHYRLLSLRFHAIPVDRRTKKAQLRSVSLVTPLELASLLLQLPFFAFVAQVVLQVLVRSRELAGLEVRWVQLMTLAWALFIGVFVVRHFFHYWRRRQMDSSSARLLLQDVLWHETRGEQRSLNRWLAWRKVTQKEQEG